ncbi:MAG: trypsin-like peptidase domain-containing protein [Candidatus Brocadiales bacterium]
MVLLISFLLLLSIPDLACAKDNKAEQLFRQAERYLMKGQKYEAIACLKEALESEHQFVPAFNLLGEVYSDMEEYEKSLTAYNKSLGIKPRQKEIIAKVKILKPFVSKLHPRYKLKEEERRQIAEDSWWYKPSAKESTMVASAVFVEPEPELEMTPIVSMGMQGLVTIYTKSFGGTIKGLGSGFLIDPSGEILTNKHVIEAASNISVKMSRGNGNLYDAKIIRAHPQLDLALIRANIRDASPLSLGDSDSLKIGEPALALGNPGLGDEALEATATKGVISGLRKIDGINYIQTDVAINPGNSGGPLINVHGQVVGVCTAKAAGKEGINFAIPINYARAWLAK